MSWKVYYSTTKGLIKIKYFDDKDSAELYRMFMVETLGIREFMILPRISYNGSGG